MCACGRRDAGVRFATDLERKATHRPNGRDSPDRGVRMEVVDLSVVIPFYNAASTLALCLEGLSRQRLPRDRFEVIAVDNNADDGSADVVRRYPDVQLLHEPTQGAYAARNRGAAAARGRILVLTDPDCVADSDWLETIAREMQAPEIDVLIGGYVPPVHSNSLRLLVFYENTKDAFVFGSGIPELYYGHTNNMAIRRQAFERFGPFVDRRRGADTIFVRRVVNALPCSVVRYSAAARVHHLELDRVRTYYRKMSIYGESRESYRHLSWTRPLTLRERATVFRRTCAAHGLSTARSLHLFALLAVGLAAWRWGRTRAQWRRLSDASDGTAPPSPRTAPAVDRSTIPP